MSRYNRFESIAMKFEQNLKDTSLLIFRTWEEPFDQAIYCLATDGNWSLVCGTARHGMVRLWDMRHSKPVQLFYVKHPFSGQSSPVYSVAFDQKNLYVALDQCLNLLSFSGYIKDSKKYYR